MTDQFCVFLDAGHGGIDPNGNYTTPGGKRFFHPNGIFHNGGFFYEGVFNRQIVDRVADKLQNLGIRFVKVSHPYLDLSLEYRVKMANWYHRMYRNGIYVSTHANASPGQVARGFEIYTTPGNTRSDSFADMLWNQVNELLGDRIRMRSDRSDGDYDKEARFYVIRRTVMPAILIEHLFFDNFNDAQLLMNEEVQEYFAEAQVRAIIEFLQTL